MVVDGCWMSRGSCDRLRRVLGAWLWEATRAFSPFRSHDGARQQLSSATSFPLSNGCLPRTSPIDAIIIRQSLQTFLDMDFAP